MQRTKVNQGVYAARRGRGDFNTVYQVKVTGPYTEYDNGEPWPRRVAGAGFPIEVLGIWQDGSVAEPQYVPGDWDVAKGQRYIPPAALVDRWEAMLPRLLQRSEAEAEAQRRKRETTHRYANAKSRLQNLSLDVAFNDYGNTCTLNVSQMEALAERLYLLETLRDA